MVLPPPIPFGERPGWLGSRNEGERTWLRQSRSAGSTRSTSAQILERHDAAERAPMTTLETQKTALNTQGTAYTSLAGKLGALESALNSLTDADGFSPFTVASGDPDAVGVTATSGSVAGLYEVVVSELAHAQVMASTSTYASPDEVIATGGNLNVALFGNPPVQIPPAAIAGSMTVGSWPTPSTRKRTHR